MDRRFVAAAGQPKTYEVRRSRPTSGVSVLFDTGPDVAADSLAVANLVYWTRGGVARSAPLR